MPFAQLVIGPPGSGKTTYCYGQYQFLSLLSRPCSVINLDPANDRLPYPCAVDINKLISVRDVMAELSLGPNAAMLYCIEYLEKNVDWLIHELKRVMDEQREGKTGQIAGHGDQESPVGPVSAGFEYLIFDLPGQVELSTNHPALKRILETLDKQLGLRFVAVHLTDATHITDASRYVSILILALRAMLTLELPHVNVLSKVDLLGQSHISRSKRSLDRYGPDSDDDEMGTDSNKHSDEELDSAEPGLIGRAGMGLESELAFNLDFYTQVQDLSYLRDLLSRPSGPGSSRRNEKYGKLNEAICELVEDFGLVSFETLAVEDRRSMFRLLQVLDKAVGYIYVSPTTNALDFGEEEDEGAYEPGRASATAGAALRAQTRASMQAHSMGADPHSLFSVADRGDPLGWGDALEVQERYIDHRELYEEAEMEERKKRHEKEWEDKVWSEVRKVAKEEQEKKTKQTQPSDTT
ncbi:related to GPN-loop GTPase 2 homolog [Ustilago trichophora]|uniref:Related to GPN-loop GTPase 2 homolog n=1 Tax=Ustilago trichophora TaxID=86804 RepID=A0A5C3DPK4_9BASI|nr:related to GPN-loop GTPase 2 homolog [Ustilago trichophora]